MTTDEQLSSSSTTMPEFGILTELLEARIRSAGSCITGRDVMGDQQRAVVRGVSGFFRKPFDGPALLATIDNALRPHGGNNAQFH